LTRRRAPLEVAWILVDGLPPPGLLPVPGNHVINALPPGLCLQRQACSRIKFDREPNY